MATRQGTQVNDSDGRVNYSWSGLAQATSDVGSAVGTQEFMGNFTAQAVGTFGAAGAVALQGSSDGTNWATLDDAGGTPVSMTASTKIWRLGHVPKFLRPSVTAGDGTTNLTVNVSGVRL